MNLHREAQFQEGLIHLRVAARHERARAAVDDEGIQAIMADGGALTVEDVARLVEARVGRLTGVRFDVGSATRTRVPWSGRDDAGAIIRGHVELHGGVSAGGVVVWATVVLDDQRKDSRDQQLAEIAYMGRALLRRMREVPNTPVALIIGEIVRIVDVCEREVEP